MRLVLAAQKDSDSSQEIVTYSTGSFHILYKIKGKKKSFF